MAIQRPDHPPRHPHLHRLGRQAETQPRAVRRLPPGPLELLRRCLAGEPGTVPYRVAGSLLLLYAQPLVRIAAMQTTQVQIAPTELRILLGDEAALVPEPFAQLLREHLAARPNLRTANTNGSPWLFPGYRAGRHLHAQSIMDRLRAIGIDLLGARNAALVDALAEAAIDIDRRDPARIQPPSHPAARRAGGRADEQVRVDQGWQRTLIRGPLLMVARSPSTRHTCVLADHPARSSSSNPNTYGYR